KMVI
ncbi:hypothetical protein ACTFIU_000383, partial [Dictyostelium citrinum]